MNVRRRGRILHPLVMVLAVLTSAAIAVSAIMFVGSRAIASAPPSVIVLCIAVLIAGVVLDIADDLGFGRYARCALLAVTVGPGLAAEFYRQYAMIVWDQPLRTLLRSQHRRAAAALLTVNFVDMKYVSSSIYLAEHHVTPADLRKAAEDLDRYTAWTMTRPLDVLALTWFHGIPMHEAENWAKVLRSVTYSGPEPLARLSGFVSRFRSNGLSAENVHMFAPPDHVRIYGCSDSTYFYGPTVAQDADPDRAIFPTLVKLAVDAGMSPEDFLDRMAPLWGNFNPTMARQHGYTATINKIMCAVNAAAPNGPIPLPAMLDLLHVILEPDALVATSLRPLSARPDPTDGEYVSRINGAAAQIGKWLEVFTPTTAAILADYYTTPEAAIAADTESVGSDQFAFALHMMEMLTGVRSRFSTPLVVDPVTSGA